MNKNYRLAAFYLVALLTCGMIFGCIIVGYAAIPNNTIRQNAGAVMPTFNATGAGYFVGPDMIVSAARAASFVTLDTGQGANELYPMDQGVRTNDDVRFHSIDVQELNLNSVNKTDLFTYPQTEATYIVLSDGGVYRAKNGDTGVILTSGASFSTVAQAAINGGGKIIFKGTFTKTTIPGLQVPSGTEIEVPAGSTITFGNNVGDGAAIFNLSSVSQVTIWGAGTLDGNLAGQAGGSQYAVVMAGATQCRVDVYMENFRGRPVLDDGYNLKINRCYPNAAPIDFSLQGLMAGHPNVNIIEKMDDDGSWVLPGGAVWDTDNVFCGNASVKMTIPGATGVQITHVLTTPLDLTKQSIGVWIKWDSIAAGASSLVVQYLLDAPNTSNRFYVRREYIPTGLFQPNEWVYAGIVPQSMYPVSVIGAADVTNIQKIYVKIYSAASGFDVYVDALTKVAPIFPNGAIVLGFDGPQTSQFENAFPIMQERNLKGVMWAVTDWVDAVGYGTLDQLKTLQAAGWDISSHASEMLNLGAASPGEVERVVAKAKDWLISNGFAKGARFFSYPSGIADVEADLIVQDYHQLSRLITSNYIMGGLPLTDQFGVVCLSGKGVLATAKTQVNNLILTGGFGMFYWHNIQTPKQAGELTIAEFEELMDYIVASGVQVITLSDIVDKYLTYIPTTTEPIYIGGLWYVTENMGTETILNGTTSIVITHGLAYTPTSANTAWTVSYLENPTNDPGSWYIDTFTATQATIHVFRDPGVSNLDIAWSARRTP